MTTIMSLFTTFFSLAFSTMPAPALNEAPQVAVATPAPAGATNVIAPETIITTIDDPGAIGMSLTTTSSLPVALQTKITADAIVAKVQGVYKSTKQLTANFEQNYTNVAFGSKKKSTGKLYVKKPGKMRWDYAAKKGSGMKVRKSFLSDGTTFWAVEHHNKQVFKKSLKDDVMPVIVSFLLGQGDLRKEYIATLETSKKYGGASDIVLKLTPKKKSTVYKNLFLVIDSATSHVKESVVIEYSNNVNHVKFIGSNTTKEVSDKWFSFDEKTAKAKQYKIIRK